MVPSISSDTVPLVVIGYGRKNIDIFMPPLFEPTSYLMTAGFDLIETYEPYRLTPHNLGVALHNLIPRPLALVVGIAVDESIIDSVRAVWDEYVETVLKVEYKENEQWKRNCFVALPLTHKVDPSILIQPPDDIGWEAEMFQQLDRVFFPNRA